MRTYYPRLDHAVPDCSGFSCRPWGRPRHDLTKADKTRFSPFAEMGDVRPGVNDLARRVNEITRLLGEVADGYSDSETGGYEWW